MYPHGAGRLRVPEVISLTRYDRMPATAVAFSRRNVAKRDHHTCQYCGVQPGWDQITIDHVLPRSRGGRRAGPTASPPAWPATPGRPTGPPSRPACGSARRPVRPLWKPLFAAREARVESWSRFLAHEPELALA